MNCEDFKEILLTDYLDDRLSEAKKAEIDAHLDICPDCRQLISLTKNTISEPFRKEKKTAVPEYLWYRIQEQVNQNNTAPTLAQKQLRYFLNMPRPAFAFSAAMLFIVILFSVFHIPLQQGTVGRNINGEVSYLYELASGSIGYAAEASKGYGTAIEKLLL